jgi:hypothetical protein
MGKDVVLAVKLDAFKFAAVMVLPVSVEKKRDPVAKVEAVKVDATVR